MLMTDFAKIHPQRVTACNACGAASTIEMHGYSPDTANGNSAQWCADCALQLARKILEDLCALGKGGRHG